MKIISLFSGAGGLDLDLKKQDLQLLWQMNTTPQSGKPMKKIILRH